jgi:hypothetical protein
MVLENDFLFNELKDSQDWLTPENCQNNLFDLPQGSTSISANNFQSSLPGIFNFREK